MKRLVLLICILSPMAFAQEKAAASANPLSDNNRHTYKVLQMMILRSAERMPEEHYGFKPVASVRGFGQLVAHVADSQYYFCSSVLNEKNPPLHVEKNKTGKAEIIAALKEVFAHCERAYDSVTDENAAGLVTTMNSATPRLSALMYNNMHTTLHYGNMVTYLRMKDILPPSSEPDFMKEARAKK